MPNRQMRNTVTNFLIYYVRLSVVKFFVKDLNELLKYDVKTKVS